MLNNRGIPVYYDIFSQDDNGNAHINMQMDFSLIDFATIASSAPTNAVNLHTALKRLTGNPPNVSPVNKIGLIIADSFVHRPGLLGLMFDMGFDPSGMDAVPGEFNSVPREGCAVFLDAIRRIRSADNDVNKELVFTAIHELGHVFNLKHLNDFRNFMSSSNAAAPLPVQAYVFTDDDTRRLSKADSDLRITPGGSKFDDLGILDSASNNPFDAIRKKSRLQMKISINQDSFWYFEPVELDISLKCDSTITVDDKIDPGYEDFVIFINKPDGTRFRYRSPRIYCRNTEKLTIAKGKPFLRDVSIFGQSGGYTFQSPGKYEIQCIFNTGLGYAVASNIVSVYVKEPLPGRSGYDQLENALTYDKAALLLYHRSGKPGRKAMEILHGYCTRKKNDQLATNIRYALTKYEAQRKLRYDKKETAALYRYGQSMLDKGMLSKARQKNIIHLMHKLEK